MKHALRSAFRALALFACLLALPASSRAASSLLVYDFGLHHGPAGNADHVRSLGFEGIVTRVATPADLAKLQAYAAHVATIDGFDLLAYLVYDFADPASPLVWRSSLPTLASVGAPLWVIVRSAPSTAAVQDLLLEMAATSQLLAIPTVIYPHWDTSIETAAEAATLIRQVAHPNLSNSLHTCHEIRAGNQYELPAVVAAHAGETDLVTIAGAEDKAYAGPPMSGGPPWDDAIMPLDRGDFDLQPFLQALKDANYNGRVILHTFGITGEPDHLERSLLQYEKYLVELH